MCCSCCAASTPCSSRCFTRRNKSLHLTASAALVPRFTAAAGELGVAPPHSLQAGPQVLEVAAPGHFKLQCAAVVVRPQRLALPGASLGATNRCTGLLQLRSFLTPLAQPVSLAFCRCARLGQKRYDQDREVNCMSDDLPHQYEVGTAGALQKKHGWYAEDRPKVTLYPNKVPKSD